MWTIPHIPECAEDLVSLGEEAPQAVVNEYVYLAHLGLVHASIGILEQTTLSLLAMSKNNQPWQEYPHLRKLTYGKLINEIIDFGCHSRSSRYLKGINKLRNNFVHDWYWSAPFPGDVEQHSYLIPEIYYHLRKSAIHFRRAEMHMQKIFTDIGLLVFIDDSQAMLVRHDFWERLEEND